MIEVQETVQEEVRPIRNVDVVARALVDLRAVVQRSRIQFGNRKAAMQRGDDQGIYEDLIDVWYGTFLDIEASLDRDITQIAKEFPIVEIMVSVKGIGKLLAVKVVALVDIARADTVSSLWKFAGYGVTDGERDRLRKGEKAPFNKTLKTTCFLVGQSLMRANSPYRRIYDDARAYYDRNRPDWTKGHRHYAALRKMVKLWLSHLWVVWRELEGLPVSDPYIMAEGGHHRYYTPEEFGWKLS